MAATLEAPPPPVSPERSIGSVVLDGISWETYERLREETDSSVRIVYDNGRMQIMPPPMADHGDQLTTLRRLAEATFEIAGIDWTGYNVVTLARKELGRGAEGDEAYYVRAEPPPRGTRRFDFAVHNPPDLVIEVDITNSSIPKEPIYAAIGVAELWRIDGDALSVRRLRDDRSGYDDAATSGLLPELDVAALAEHVRLGRTLRQGEVVRRWRAMLSNV